MEKSRDLINRLATSDTSTEIDGVTFQNLLRELGFPKAIVTCGIVYLDGQGTIEFTPTSINAIAKTIKNILG
jgi:hypothetical protein